MLEKEDFFCVEKKGTVSALVDHKRHGGAPMTCTEMLSCSATTFCRFVNPLTTRVPLKPLEAEVALVS
ncbi:hypothetical protein FACS1894139_18200 [Planctomycetales bacterium]|nr:hypothetical protein [Planctomycetota bacterium]GHT01087.1 hypothetical protein FACS1894108_14400 [Planctomycetales bacterium]GHT08477.1 hypothetical protein FACS1894139_18200 [Planctomycetales bacterium]GHV22673.1 hypothetical protein AGMMS49959_13910 [Planctomycetales bacterium]